MWAFFLLSFQYFRLYISALSERWSDYEHIVKLQFNSLMLIIIKNKLKSRYRQLARRSKREVLFCEITETKQVERGMNDTYFYDCVSFKVLHFTIYVSDETLGTALHRLSEKQHMKIIWNFSNTRE